jgi:hypothetical protein
LTIKYLPAYNKKNPLPALQHDKSDTIKSGKGFSPELADCIFSRFPEKLEGFPGF